jgi:hypothetical protein
VLVVADNVGEVVPVFKDTVEPVAPEGNVQFTVRELTPGEADTEVEAAAAGILNVTVFTAPAP